MLELGIFVYLFGLLKLSIHYFRILIMLLRLEFISLGILFILVIYIKDINFIFFSYFIVFIVIEARLGLSLLILGVMYTNGINYNSMSLLK
jgi:hypothetical protein